MAESHAVNEHAPIVGSRALIDVAADECLPKFGESPRIGAVDDNLVEATDGHGETLPTRG